MKQQVLVIAALVLSITSCKKDDGATTPPPVQEPAPLISASKTIMVNNQSYDLKREFFYDGNRRLIEIKHSGTNTSTVTEKYTYSANKVQYQYFNGASETTSFATEYTLNNSGKAEKLYSAYFNAANLSEYNAAGYLTRVNYVSNNKGTGYSLYYYSAGNRLDSVSGHYADGDRKYVQTYTYETGRKNSIGDINRGLQFLGEAQAAPVKKRTWFIYDQPGKEGQRWKFNDLDYNYEYDAGGRIKKQTIVETQYNTNGTSVSYIKEVMEYSYK